VISLSQLAAVDHPLRVLSRLAQGWLTFLSWSTKMPSSLA